MAPPDCSGETVSVTDEQGLSFVPYCALLFAASLKTPSLRIMCELSAWGSTAATDGK